MPKLGVVRRGSHGPLRPPPTELPGVLEGQIAELCRDLAVEAKRIERLHNQADDLRRAIGDWLNQSAGRANR